MISFEEFAKVELKTGKIISAEPVEGSEKMSEEVPPGRKIR